MPKRTLNLDDASVKRGLMIEIGALRGLWDVELKQRKLTRSLDQNSFWFVGVVTPFREWLRENYGDPTIDLEQAHEMLKWKILGPKELVDKETGEILRLPPRSKTLTTAEFADMIERASDWLASFCGIIVIPSDMFYAVSETRRGE